MYSRADDADWIRISPSPTRVDPRLHSLLLLRELYVHLLKRDLVKRARHLEPFRLLILPQSLARRIIKLAELFSGVKPALLQDRLSLVDLFFCGAKYRAPFRPLLRRPFGWV